MSKRKFNKPYDISDDGDDSTMRPLNKRKKLTISDYLKEINDKLPDMLDHFKDITCKFSDMLDHFKDIARKLSDISKSYEYNDGGGVDNLEKLVKGFKKPSEELGQTQPINMKNHITKYRFHDGSGQKSVDLSEAVLKCIVKTQKNEMCSICYSSTSEFRKSVYDCERAHDYSEWEKVGGYLMHKKCYVYVMNNIFKWDWTKSHKDCGLYSIGEVDGNHGYSTCNGTLNGRLSLHSDLLQLLLMRKYKESCAICKESFSRFGCPPNKLIENKNIIYKDNFKFHMSCFDDYTFDINMNENISKK